MSKFQLCILLYTLLACSGRNADNRLVKEGKDSDKLASAKSDVKYILIRDKLYHDGEGNLWLKSVNNEDLENRTTYVVWLNTVYCDTCWTPTEDGWKDITELKDFVDTSTFHHDTTYQDEGVDVYADKRYKYRHKWMADGGTISLDGK